MNIWFPIRRLMGVEDRGHPPLLISIAAGGTAGAIASAICTPADVIKIRMQVSQPTKQTSEICECKEWNLRCFEMWKSSFFFFSSS
jgi:hypothetical protein